MFKDLPNITLEIGLGRERKTIVNIFYREWTGGVTGLSDNGSQIERLDRQIMYWQSLYDQDRDILLCGDANLCARSWNDRYYDYSKKVLANMIQDQLLENANVQLVESFTRSEMNNGQISQSCIDHIYSNCASKCDKPKVESAGDSDHLAVLVTKYTKELLSKPNTIKKRNYKNFDVENFLIDIYNSELNAEILACNNIEDAAKKFENIFSTILNRYAPIKLYQCRSHYVPFISPDTQLLMKERDTLKEEATSTGCKNLLAEYKKKRNQVKARVVSDKTEYYKNKFHDQSLNIQKVWKTVYNILGKVDNKAPKQLRQGDRIINNPRLMAEILNKKFKDKVSILRNQTNDQPIVNPVNRLKKWLSQRESVLPKFTLKPITLSQLREVLRKIKFSRSHGIDFVDAFSIKLAGPLIEDALLHIINLSIKSGVFASSWKTQLVLPLHKKNDRLDCSNYRPVSHIVELGKIVEYVVHKQVYDHFEKYHIFHGNHHGFLTNHSTATALIQLQDLWLSAAEDKQLSAALLLDLSAAFDIVDHKIFLDKLCAYKFSPEAIEWFSSYLGDRKQVVQVESKFSDPEEIGSFGVPQGSILGPLVFIIFNNDLPASSVNGESVLYADDDTVSVSASEPDVLQNKIQDEAKNSTDWIADNRMVCSGEKTKLLVLGTSQLRKTKLLGCKISVSVCGKTVEASRSEPLLGLIVNDEMCWAEYLDGLFAKLSQRVGLLMKVSQLMPSRRFKIICQGLFYSKLLYCLQVFGNVWGIGNNDLVTRRYTAFSKEHNRKLQTLQNKVLRMKTGLPPRTSTKTLIETSGDLSVQQLTAFSTLSTCHKMIASCKPRALSGKLKNGSTLTRQGTNIRIDANLTLSRGAFLYRAATLFNKLPQDIREDMSMQSFKKKIKNWIKLNVPVKPS